MREHFRLPPLVLAAVVALLVAIPTCFSVAPTGAGTVLPSGSSSDSRATRDLSAVVGTGCAFFTRAGDRSGSYEGALDPTVTGTEGPNPEQVRFSIPVMYRVTFSERGLPTGTLWSVTLNGVSNESTSALITFSEPNGSYSFSLLGMISGASGTRYMGSPGSGSFDIEGVESFHSVSYLVQFEFSASATPSNAGTVLPALGWYDDGKVVEVSALAEAGYQFVSWQGAGAGNYTGTTDPGNVTVLGPITEVAVFSTAPHNTSTTDSALSSGTVPTWVFLVTLGLLFLVLIVAVVGGLRRGRAPPRRPRPLTPADVPAPTTPPSTGGAKAEPWRED